MKTFFRVFCLAVAILTLFCSLGASAATYYKEGSEITFHNASPNYIVNDKWIEGTYCAELQNGVLFVSVADFKDAFKCNISYNFDDTSICLQLSDKILWQALGYDTLFINDEPYSVPAPYISSQTDNPVMIPLEPYASTMGYNGSFETTDVYPPGQMTLKIDAVPYTLVRVEVNQAAQLVTVIGKSPSGNEEPVKHMLCSTGTGTRTPNGTYRITALGTNWYYFGRFNCYVRYCSQITGNICFHSLTFNTMSNSSLSRTAYNAIGSKASHGCIRLFVDDAKFIHQKCNRLPVKIYSGFTTPETIAIRKQIIDAKPSYSDYVKSLY